MASTLRTKFNHVRKRSQGGGSSSAETVDDRTDAASPHSAPSSTRSSPTRVSSSSSVTHNSPPRQRRSASRERRQSKSPHRSGRSHSSSEVPVVATPHYSQATPRRRPASLEAPCSLPRAESLDCLNLDFGNVLSAEHTWTAMPNCDAFVGPARAKHTAVAWGDGIFVHGGDNGRRRMLNDLLRFDTREYSWSTVAIKGQAPSPRYHHSAVVYNNNMFIFGGYTGDLHSNLNLENRNDLFQCRLDKCMWQKLDVQEGSLQPQPRSAHGAVVYSHYMYVFAGFDGCDRLNDMWRIDLESLECPVWEQVTQNGDLPPTCCNCPCVVAGEHMFVFSGQSGIETTNTLFSFAFDTNTWSKVTPCHMIQGGGSPPDARYGHSLVHFNNQLYVFGGLADGLCNDMYRFDLETSRWSVVLPTELSQVPSGRCAHSACVVGSAMFMFGGKAEADRNSNEMYRFQLGTTPRCTLHDDYLQLLHSGDLADVEFVVGPKQQSMWAHVPIVAARSGHLVNAILKQRESGASPAGTVTLTFEDADPDAFRAVLAYMYSDRLPDECVGQALDATSLRRLLDIYNLSRVLEMSRLEHKCIECVRLSVSADNVLSCLRAVSGSNLEIVQEYLLNYCTREAVYRRILMSKEFEHIEQHLMLKIVRQRELMKDRRNKSAAVLQNRLDDRGTLASDMENFLFGESGKAFQDVFLQLEGQDGGEGRMVAAHRAVLAARSDYFRAMFTSGMKESRSDAVPIRIGDLVPPREAFQSFLSYMYYGSVDMPPEHSLYLFAATHFYALSNNRLQAICKTNLEQNVSAQNVFSILEAADSIHAGEMKRRALEIIVGNYVKVARLPQMKRLKPHLMYDILQAIAHSMQSTGVHLGNPLLTAVGSSTV